MNVSNVSASNKTSLPESGTKTPPENSGRKGFFETLASVFTGSQKEPTKAAKSTTEASGNGDVSTAESEGESQKTANVDAPMSHEAEQSEANTATGVDNDVTLSMDEGQQLLGQIEQANQALNALDQSGKSLPPELTEWQGESNLASLAEVTSLNEDISADLVQHISFEELEVIDTKLAQGKPLTDQEAEIIEGLKSGTAIAELSEEELAQLVALPSDVKLALSEAQTAQSTMTRQAAALALTSQTVAQDLKHAAVDTAPQAVDKSAPPTGVMAAGMNPALEQMATSNEMNRNATLEAGSLKAMTEHQDKAELTHGLAGQLQAAATQHGGTTHQQARLDAAQQAQLPLQLTKELANDQVAERVQMMMSKNLKNLDIRLDPPELGRMQIRMTMNSDLANVHFTVTNPQARDIIEQTLPRLREMLAQQGMQLADSSVQQQSRGEQQGGYSSAEQNRKGSDGRGLSGLSGDGLDADIEMNVNVASPRDGISYYA